MGPRQIGIADHLNNWFDSEKRALSGLQPAGGNGRGGTLFERRFAQRTAVAAGDPIPMPVPSSQCYPELGA